MLVMKSMGRWILIGAMFTSLFVAACGGGASSTTSSDKTVAADTPTHQPPSPPHQHHAKTGQGANAHMCFKPGALTVDAGESFSGIGPGQSFTGRERIIKRAVHGALIPTVRAELRAARRHADTTTMHEVREVTAAASRGIEQVTRDPNLLVRGQIPGFDHAQALAGRYNLTGC